ncbi:MAG: ATP-binding protein [Oscillospiraceae bacterium]|nr:ATP-binding protein [Oscillospiraceae bacterium]
MEKWTIPADFERWEYILKNISELLQNDGFSRSFINSLSLAADEVFANISMYSCVDRSGEVEITFDIQNTATEKMALMTFKDNGAPFDPLKAPEPDFPDGPASGRSPGGLGIFIIKNQVDHIDYEYTNDHNILTLKKYQKIRGTL